MKKMVTYVTICTFLASSSAAIADCLFPLPRYLKLRIESCASPLEVALSAIDGKGYTEYEVSRVKSSADYISIVQTAAISDVDIIVWHSAGHRRVFKGKERAIPDSMPTRYVLLATSVVECKERYLGKVHIFEPYGSKRCNDQLGPKETDAAELTRLPDLVPSWDEEELENAPKKLLDALR